MNSEKRKYNLLLKPDLRKRINQTTLKTYSEKADLSEVYTKPSNHKCYHSKSK